jgi:hypothetical protein
MMDERDPILERLFAAADKDMTDEAFTAGVMARADASRRWTLFGRLGAGLALAACAVLLALALLAPGLHDAVGALNQTLQAPVVDLGGRRLPDAFSPVNTVAGVLALAGVGLLLAYRSLVAWLFS